MLVWPNSRTSYHWGTHEESILSAAMQVTS